MALKTQLPLKSHSSRERWRAYYPLLAIMALVLASLACFNAELRITVKHEEEQVDTLDVMFSQYLTESYIAAAKKVNEERAADFAAAGRSSDLDNLLPVNSADMGELFNVQKYQDQGYTVSNSDKGFSAFKTFTLDKDVVTEEWTVKIIHNPDHPEQIIYRAKIWLDLTNLKGSLFELRSQPLSDKPNLNPESESGSSGGFLGEIIGGMAQDAEQEMTIEQWYVQKALQNSDPINYLISVELPGTVVLHQLDGQTAGFLEDNRVTLILDEAVLMANAGKKLIFQVESIRKDCRLACDPEKHQLWDGKDEGVSCDCICDKGWTMVEGFTECTHCDTICQLSDPNLVIDPENCQTNTCACQCKEGLEMNNAGTECIDEYDAWVEDQQRSEEGGPSPQELGDLFIALLDPDNDKNINQLPGWFLLTSGERENLLNVLEQLGLVVDRSQLTVDKGPEMSTDERYQQILENQNRLERVRELAINKIKDEIKKRRLIQSTIIREISGNYEVVQTLLEIPGWITTLSQSPTEIATGFVEGKLTDAVTERIQKEAYGNNPPTIEAAAAELIKQISQMATQGCVDDYYQYLGFFEKNCGANCTGDTAALAHEMALESLRENIAPGRENWAREGEAYDNAFRKLNPDLP